MRHKLFYILLLLSFTVSAQKHYFVKKGAVVKGYDVVAYFNNTAVEGKKELSVKHDGATFLFSSQENLVKFKKNPNKYIPQYGGYCAYAIGSYGKKVSVNPETFEIRDGKLYLFYNKGNTNTLKLWLDEGAEDLKSKADNNWLKITKG